MALFHKNKCWLVTARLWDYVSDDVVDYIEGLSTVTPPDDEVPATVHTISSDMFYPSDIHDYGLNTIHLKSADTRIIGDFSGITIHQRKK